MSDPIALDTQGTRQLSASVVVPTYNEELNVEAFYERTFAVLDEAFASWEIVFVDDGSRDRTPSLLWKLNSADPRVKVVRLTRNFGSHVAITAGLDHARGDVVVVMACDLQDPPELIPKLLSQWEEGHEIVWATRAEREDSLIRRGMAKVFYRLVRRFAIPDYPSTGTGSFCLLDASVVEAVRRFPERNRMTFGLVSWTGFSQAEISYKRGARHAGVSKWKRRQLVKAAIDTFISFSFTPIRFISYCGIFFSIGGFLLALWVVIQRILFGTQLRGWASLMTAILIIGGLQLLTMGILGEYLARIGEDSRQRPLYIVREKLGIDDEQPGRSREPG
jgi:glycosyltransferase involved in cell wall biosynthesis